MFTRMFKRSMISLFLGTVTSWLVKESLAPLFMGGKTFVERSLSIQIGFLIACIVLISFFFGGCISIASLLFHRQLEWINNRLTSWIKEGMVKFIDFFTNLPSKISSRLVNPGENTRAVIFRMYKNIDDSIRINSLIFQAYLAENTIVIIILAVIALAAYGFELFNLNITLDDEIFAFPPPGVVNLILQEGRWGMYLLTKYFLPYSIIPFVPLGLALLFQLGGMLLMLKSWKVTSKLEKIIVGAVGLTFPSLAYVYVFSPLCYGIGIGFFCVGLSLFLYSEKVGSQRYLAIIPAVLAFSIYQTLILVLILAFLIYLIRIGLQPGQRLGQHLVGISFIHILALFAYYVMQRLFLPVEVIPVTSRISGFFNIQALRDNFGHVLAKCWMMLFSAYSGDISIYSVKIPLLGALLIVALLSVAIGLLRLKSSIANKLLVVLFTLMVLFLPFASGLLTNGFYLMRSLLGLPFAISGLTMLALSENSRIYKMLVVSIAVICIFQFTVSTNHLFASSNLALQNDRLLVSRLIGKIEDAKEAIQTGEKVKYLEIVGESSSQSSELIFKREAIGASFFVPYSNSFRVIEFMKTLDYQGLQITPMKRRYQLIEIGTSMPIWPDKGSVRVVGDTVLIKFGAYNSLQKGLICGRSKVWLSKINKETANSAFCKK